MKKETLNKEEQIPKEESAIGFVIAIAIALLCTLINTCVPSSNKDQTSPSNFILISAADYGLDELNIQKSFIFGDTIGIQQLYFSYKIEGKPFEHSLELIDQKGHALQQIESKKTYFKIISDINPNEYGINKNDIKKAYLIVSNLGIQYLCFDFNFDMKYGFSLTKTIKSQQGTPILYKDYQLIAF